MAGRRSLKDEALIMNICNKTWRQFERWMDDPEVEVSEKMKVAAPLLAKTVPTNIKHKHDYRIAYVSAIPRAIEPPTIDITQAAHDAAQEEEDDQ